MFPRFFTSFRMTQQVTFKFIYSFTELYYLRFVPFLSLMPVFMAVFLKSAHQQIVFTNNG